MEIKVLPKIKNFNIQLIRFTKSGRNLFMEQIIGKVDSTALYRNTLQDLDSFVCHSVHVTERQVVRVSCAASNCLPVKFLSNFKTFRGVQRERNCMKFGSVYPVTSCKLFLAIVGFVV